MANKVLLFTYGTLMRGNANNHYLNGAKLVCEGRLSGYECYGMPYGFPAIIEASRGVILGEVWEVPISHMKSIDRLEGYVENEPYRGLYRRVERLMIINGEERAVYCYVWNSAIPLGSVYVPSNTKWNMFNIYE